MPEDQRSTKGTGGQRTLHLPRITSVTGRRLRVGGEWKTFINSCFRELGSQLAIREGIAERL